MVFKTSVEKIFFKIIIITSIVGGLIFGYAVSQIRNFAGIENLKRFQPNLPTKLYDINGELISELFFEKRDLISFEELPQSLINAFLASEDKDFYTHIKGIFKMHIKNIKKDFVKELV